MKLIPYQKMLAMGKVAIEEAMAALNAKRIQKRAELKILELDDKIFTKEQKIQQLCLEKEIDFDKLCDELDAVALLERRKVQLAGVVEQLFPAESADSPSTSA